MLIHISTILIPALLFLCAIFAAGEAALLSLNRIQLEALRVSRPTIYRRIQRLIASPDALLSTVIISNETLNIVLGTCVASTVQLMVPEGRWGIVVSVVATSALLLTISEVLPKVLAFRLPVVLASVLVFPIGLVHWLLTPSRKVFLSAASRILRSFGVQPAAPPSVNEQEFLTLVEVGAESGSLEREEKDLIVNVFQFSDRTVQSVMTPWNQILTIHDKMTVAEVLQQIRARVFSRIPVLASDTGAVIGVLYTKELLKLMLSPEAALGSTTAKMAVLPPYIVSASKKIATLFREFKQKKIHFAVVVNEYGKQLGIVTLDDVLNALFHTRKKTGTTAA
ncbi:MAG: HlyC/CorC family transporter [Deltaproteobacteria bacterium]|nr:HlyC/CorC family transporter [Deltaproteobacteria bacterium]MBI3293914.1 HlyC/CorC family transporter [Deltaproteobacteria bacterium]